MSLIVDSLRKSYGSHEAVKDLSFEVPQGSVFAFLGSNGAGKSTTIGCMTTVMRPSSGHIHVDGLDVVRDADAVRERIGVVFQQSILDPLLTVEENLRSRAGFYGLTRTQAAERIETLSETVGLGTYLRRPYGQLSGGQKRRADVARAMLHEPSLIFLDEPTAGLDPQSREQIWNAMQALRRDQGVTIFLTTHYMEETEQADSVCIIDAGRIVAQGTPAELRARYSSSILTIRANDPASIANRLEEIGAQVRTSGGELTVNVSSAQQALAYLNEVPIQDFEFRHGTMQDVFIAVTEGASS